MIIVRSGPCTLHGVASDLTHTEPQTHCCGALRPLGDVDWICPSTWRWWSQQCWWQQGFFLRDLGRFLQDFWTKKVADDGGLSRFLVRNLSHLWELSRSYWMCQAWRWEIGPRVAVWTPATNKVGGWWQWWPHQEPRLKHCLTLGPNGCIRVSISPRPFFWALKLCSTSEEMWMTYVGVEHELGEWLGSCDFVAAKIWPPGNPKTRAQG